MGKKDKKLQLETVAEHSDGEFQGFQWETVQPITMIPQIADSDFVKKHFGIASPFEYKLRRLDQGNERWYLYTDEETGDLRHCMSATTFAEKSMGMGYGLLNYLMEMGKEASDLHKFWAAEYGTFFHIEAGDALSNGYYNFGPDGVLAELKLMEYFERLEGFPLKKLKWYFIRKFHKDMASLFQFIKDRNVKVIAVEFPVMSYKWQIAGTIDLICELDFNGKRIICIVDFKTGKGIYEIHPLQLLLYQEMWNEHFSDICEVTHLFNWKPSDFKVEKSPTYQLKNQTNSVLDWEGRLMIGINEGWFDKSPRANYLMHGQIKVGDSIDDNVKVLNHLEMYKKIKEHENQQEQEAGA